MRPSEIKVGELKKSKKLQTHAAKNSGMSAGCGEKRCAGPCCFPDKATSSPVGSPSWSLTFDNLCETPTQCQAHTFNHRC